MIKTPVYMDYAATTPVDPRVAAKMAECLTSDGVYANPASSSHVLGRQAKGIVEQARSNVAALINADRGEIVWTSGATESDNLALIGTARFCRQRGTHIITSRTEHKAVLDSCKQLEKENFRVTYLKPGEDGLISPAQVEEAISGDTILVSLMHVNNEIGVINDIAAVGGICRDRGVMFHVDAAQSAGKVPIDVQAINVDMMSFSAHKIYGPKGIGALYVCHKPLCRLEPILHGGGHEGGLRSGTLPTHQIAGMGEAFRIAREQFDTDHDRLLAMRRQLWEGISQLGGVYINGSPEQRVAGILNVSFDEIEGETLLLCLRRLAVSSGSACTSASSEPSYVLRALGRNDQLAQASIRFSIGRFTTEEEIDFAIKEIREQVTWMRGLTPAVAGQVRA